MTSAWCGVSRVGVVGSGGGIRSRSWVTMLRGDERSLGSSATGAWCAGGVAAAETLHEGWAGGGAVGVGCGLGVVGVGAEHFE